MAINLTGKYDDGAMREYVVMQDDVQRTDRRASIAFVRVLRQRDEEIGSGTVFIADETFDGAGDDDAARNAAIARALVTWLAGRPGLERYFQLSASLGATGPSTSIEMRSETYGKQE